MIMIFRNILFYLGIIPATFIFGVLSCSLFFLPYPWRYWVTTRWSYFFVFWAKVTCGLSYHIQNPECLPKQTAIVISNHQSAWETIFIQTLFPLQTWVLKKELLLIPFFGWGLWLIRPIAINRKQTHSIKILLKDAETRLNEGSFVILFPEGTRVKPNQVKPFSRSFAALSKASHFPVVPIVHNAGLFWPKGPFIKKPGVIQVRIGPLIYPDNKTIEEIKENGEKWIHEKSVQLSKLT